MALDDAWDIQCVVWIIYGLCILCGVVVREKIVQIIFGDELEGNTMLVPIVSNKNVLLPTVPNQMVSHAVNAILEPYPWNKPSKRSLDGLLITSKVGMG